MNKTLGSTMYYIY